jgi:rubredoxin
MPSFFTWWAAGCGLRLKKIDASAHQFGKSPMVYEYMKTPEGDYMCVHCNVIKKKQSTMHMHYRANHDGALKHKCRHCTYESATKQGLENHINARHPSDNLIKEFSCPSCPFESLTKGGLRSHYLLRHLSKEVSKYFGKTDEGEIQCTACGTDFASKPAYVYHLVACIQNELSATDREALGV